MNATVKAVKTPNYTPEVTEAIIEAYKAGEPVAAIAEKFGRSVKSLTAKLSRCGVYEKKAYVTKTGEKAETKGEIVAKIAEKLNVPVEDVGSLESATKVALKLIFDNLAVSAE